MTLRQEVHLWERVRKREDRQCFQPLSFQMPHSTMAQVVSSHRRNQTLLNTHEGSWVYSFSKFRLWCCPLSDALSCRNMSSWYSKALSFSSQTWDISSLHLKAHISWTIVKLVSTVSKLRTLSDFLCLSFFLCFRDNYVLLSRAVRGSNVQRNEDEDGSRFFVRDNEAIKQWSILKALRKNAMNWKFFVAKVSNTSEDKIFKSYKIKKN